MSSPSSSLAIAQFTSVGSGYRSLNRATQDPALEVVELAPLGEKSVLLLKGPKENVKQFITNTKLSDLDRSLVIDDIDDRVMQAYLSLSSTPLQQSMAILESDFIGDLFAWAQAAVQIGIGIVDFRWFRTHTPSGYLTLTGNENPEILQWLLYHKQSSHRITIMPSLTERMRKYISTDPQ